MAASGIKGYSVVPSCSSLKSLFLHLKCSQFVHTQNCCEDLLLSTQVTYNLISLAQWEQEIHLSKSRCTRRLCLPGNTKLLQLPHAFNLQSSVTKSCCHYSYGFFSDVNFFKEIHCHPSFLRVQSAFRFPAKITLLLSHASVFISVQKPILSTSAYFMFPMFFSYIWIS